MSDWLTYSPTSGHGNGIITITADTLSELEDRVATIVAINNDYSLTATTEITQTAYRPTGVTDYLTFNIISGGTINWISDVLSLTIEYKKNNDDWVSITSITGGTSFNVSGGDIVKFRGDNDHYGITVGYCCFSGGTAKYEVEGNIMSLISSTNFQNLTSVSNYAFSGLFWGCDGLISAENLILPATTLGNNCYYNLFRNCSSLVSAPTILPATTLAGACYWGMFLGCTSLTNTPELPATTLAINCYSFMFKDCTSLTTAPELPATTLAAVCYESMFDGCTSLISAPALQSTTLAYGCYWGMFWNCTSLTTAPELPATTLLDSCYIDMFKECTSLNYIKCLATDMSAPGCTDSWVTGVASIGTFVKHPNATWSTGNSGIPTGWVVQDASTGDTGNVQLILSGGTIMLGTDCSANFNSPSTAFTVNGLGICGFSGDTNIGIVGESTYMFSSVRQEDLSAVTITYDWSHDSITYLNAATLVLNFDDGTTSKIAYISYANGVSSTVVDLRDYFTPDSTKNVNLTINASIV